MTEPIKPQDINKLKVFPEEVIEAFNELIIKYWRTDKAHFTEEEAMKLTIKKFHTTGDSFRISSYYYDRGFFDIEEKYREAGWDVAYDKPGYCEDYKATFTFTKK